MSDPNLRSGDPLFGYATTPPPGAGGPPVAPLYAPRRQLAGWWSRVGAHLIDGLIICVAAVVLLVVLGAIFGVGFFASDTAGVVGLIVGLLVWIVCVAVAALAYAPLMMARTNGQTLGRKALGIRVIRADGQPIDLGYAMLREVAVKWLLFGVVGGSLTGGIAPLLDYLWPLWDEENRALHDLIVNSRTVIEG